jgi:hypothetical protein
MGGFEIKDESTIGELEQHYWEIKGNSNKNNKDK